MNESEFKSGQLEVNGGQKVQKFNIKIESDKLKLDATDVFAQNIDSFITQTLQQALFRPVFHGKFNSIKIEISASETNE